MNGRSTATFTIAALLALSLAACEQSPTSPTATTSIQLAPAATGASASLIRLSQHGETGPGNVSLEAVGSIDVVLQGVDALRLEEDGASWRSLSVEDQELDLLDLPEEGVEVARGELEAGDYCNVRFFVGDATITFEEDVTLGDGPAAETFEAGEPHSLFIPSAGNTGVKVPTATFSVGDEDESVTVAFDAGESVQTVSVTGNGVLMTPVLTADEGSEEILGCEGVEDDGNGEEDGENGEDGEE